MNLIHQADVHRLLARFSAQFVQVEVPTVKGDLGHLLAPTSSSKPDYVVARIQKGDAPPTGEPLAGLQPAAT